MSVKQHAHYLALTGILISGNSWALNLTGYQFTDSYRYSLLSDSLKEKFDGDYVVSASYGYIHSPFFFSDTYLHDKRRDIIEANHILTTGLTVYATKNIAVGVELAALHNVVDGYSFTTMGDSRIHARFNLRRQNNFSLSLNPHLIIPTGDQDNFSTQGSVGGGLSVVAEKSYFDRLHFLASVGAQSSKNNVFMDVDHRQLLLTQLGVSYDLYDKLNLNFESYRNMPLVQDTYQDDGKYFITAKHKTGERFSTYAGIGASGLEHTTRDSYSAFAGVKFFERVEKKVQEDVVSLPAAAPVRKMIQPDEEIYFGHNKHQLESIDKQKLDQYVDYLNRTEEPVQRVEIDGYSSAAGPQAYNKKISEKRANSVKVYMKEQGIPEDKMSTQSFGEEFEQNPDEAKNRKVRLNIIK